TCRIAGLPACEACGPSDDSDHLPIGNRRYSRLETCATSAAASPALQDIARYLSWPFIGFMPRLFGGRALLTSAATVLGQAPVKCANRQRRLRRPKHHSEFQRFVAAETRRVYVATAFAAGRSGR